MTIVVDVTNFKLCATFQAHVVGQNELKMIETSRILLTKDEGQANTTRPNQSECWPNIVVKTIL